jgi:hypothetical protein
MGLRGTSLALVAGLVAIGLYAASPFLCNRLVGTGESYNYSLSVADALEQMRSGNVPPLAGQTLYAFNGRIHPLRDAPYLYYLSAALDILTRHRLTFWEIQNACLAFSLTAAGLACYLGLRKGAGCPPLLSFLLSSAYVISPALLGAAYSFDLFMTVYASPFVPLAVASCVRGCVRPSFSADAWLAASLAGAWLAHPPVALWLTVGVVVVRAAVFLRKPSWKVLASGTCALGLGAILAAFVFVSVATLNSDLNMIPEANTFSGFADAMVAGVRIAFPASLLPVGRGASGPGDLQFGYLLWLIFSGSLLVLARASPAKVDRNARSAAAGLLAFTGLLLVLLLPVPFLTLFIWKHIPNMMLAVTNLWPMQRLYMVAVPFTLFGAALVLPAGWRELRPPRWLGPLLVTCGAGWSLYQAQAFVGRGLGNRWTLEATRSAYLPSNLDLTVTSYAFYGVPSTFIYGVVDPQFEFRLQRGGTEEIASPLAAALEKSPVVDSGVVGSANTPAIVLKPRQRYLLTFDFHAPPASGFLQLSGTLLHRTYALPAAGPGRGFGMLDGQRRSLAVWTDGNVDERVEIGVSLSGPGPHAQDPKDFAGYTLQEVRLGDLPIRMDSLFPLRFEVDAPESGCTVETPRRFLSGYTATANGVPVIPVMSADRQVMVPVPAGHSVVELQYSGPRRLRWAFWASAAAWAAFLLWRLVGSRLPVRMAREFAGTIGRHPAVAVAICVCILSAGAWEWRQVRLRGYLRSVGPLQLDFALPYGKKGINQPLLTTGVPGKAAIIFVNCIDERHIRLGADVWGHLYQSDPIEVDFSRVQSLVVSDSAFFPLTHPRVQALDASESALLRSQLRVELNGRTAISAKTYAYETTPSEIQLGAASFGSTTDPKFFGELLRVRHLAIPRHLFLPSDRYARLIVRFPKGREGDSEPLLFSSWGGHSRTCFVTYLSKTELRITSWGPDDPMPESADVSYDPKSAHELDVEPGEAGGGMFGYKMSCSFDGRHLFGTSLPHVPGPPPSLVSGLNLGHAPSVLDRFTGRQLDLSLVTITDGSPPPAAAVGSVHMIVSFPEDKTGLSEPLLTTGHTGAGDATFVTYTDKNHVRIGRDHWGIGGVTSDPVEVDYKVPHEIWITMASPDAVASAAAGTKVSVILDGKLIVSSTVVPYPSQSGEVSVARNGIGASSANPIFTGTVQFSERTGSVPRQPAN